jgi:TPP-dependent indolepyruvate ferredoxin oxidoreductase alpha subunit
VAAGYPGTPSTEILEALVRLDPGRQVYVEWSSNEKVGLDVALGAAIGGARALCTMKHVGLNVAADTFMTSAYTECVRGWCGERGRPWDALFAERQDNRILPVLPGCRC